MPRSPLTEIINKVSALAEQIHALPEDERNYLLDLLLPEQEAAPVKPKRKRKRTTTPTGGNGRRGLPGASVAPLCQHVFPNGETCDALKVDPIHSESGGYLSYHPFVAPTAAPRAREQSSPNGAGESSVASSGTSTDVATTASGD